MEGPLQTVRDALAAHLADEAAERVDRWRGGEGGRSAAERHRWLVGRAAADAVGEAAERGYFEEGEHGATVAHLARLAADLELLDLRGRLEALRVRPLDGRGDGARLGDLLEALFEAEASARAGAVGTRLEAFAERVLARARDARQRADEAAGKVRGRGTAHPDLPEAVDAPLVRARAFLEATGGVGEEASAWLRARAGAPATWAGLARAVRAPTLDALFPPAARFRRVAASFAGSCFERDAGARLHVERGHGGLAPRVRIAARAVPSDVRLAPSRLELGVLSELAAAEGYGRALALALVAPGLPPAFRWPVEGSVARAFGGLAAQVVIEPRLLAADDRLAPRNREAVARTLGALLLLHLRLTAAAVVGGARGDLRDASEVVGEALGVAVPAPFAELLVLPREGCEARLRGSLGALAAWSALRELFDEDWYRNPRVEEALRAGAARGGALSVERWIRELGGAPDHAIARARELFAT